MPRRRSDTMRAVDAVMPLVDEFNALDEGDKLTFLDLVDPLPEGHNHKSKKKTNKKSSKSSSSKSPRATGIEQQLKSRVREQREVVTKDGDEGFDMSRLCSKCAKLADNNIHHLESDPDYHPFVEYAPSESTAAGTGD